MEKYLAEMAAASGGGGGGGKGKKGRGKLHRRKERFKKGRSKGAKGARGAGFKGKLGKLGGLPKRPQGGFGAGFGQDVGMAKVAGALGAVTGLQYAMEMLTAEYDKDGKLIDKSVKVMGVSLDKAGASVSAFGMGMSALPGKFGKIGGQIGMLGAAFEAGTLIGQGLNTVFQKLGWTGEETMQSLANWVTAGDNVFAKFGQMITGTENYSKGAEEANKKLLESIKRKGLSEKEAKDVISRSEKEKKPVHEILAQMGKISGAPKKTSALAGTTMPSTLGADLNKAAATTAAATAAATTAATTTDTPTGDTGGGMSGSFMGGPSADGSIMLRVENFMNVFAKAGTMIKQKTNRPSG